jgi:hypothetical protein
LEELMADIYLGFGDDGRPVHHTYEARPEQLLLDYGGEKSPHTDAYELLGTEVLGADRLSINGRDLSFLLDKEKLAARLHQLGAVQRRFPIVVADGKDYCPEAMMLAERLLGEW